MPKAAEKNLDVRNVEEGWLRRGFSFGLWTDPAGRAWENYVHDADELFMVLEGDVELELQGRVLRPAPREEIFVPARAVHSVRNRGASASRWAYGYRL
ncbi:MAG: cupin domain-containing protein [Elusimicrobiota bacterium]